MTTTTRRDLIRGIAGLAALAVTPGTLKPLTEDATDRFMRMARQGVVRGQHFVLERPIVLSGLGNLLIDKCKFSTAPGFDPRAPMIELRHCEKVQFAGTCYFQGPAGCAIKLDKSTGTYIGKSRHLPVRIGAPA